MSNIPRILVHMSPFPYDIDGGASLDDAAQMMEEHDFRHLPVTEEGELVGVISGDDLRAASARDGDVTVRQACSAKAYVVPHHTPLENVASHMADHHLSVALVTRDEKLVGIFTVTDVCRALVDVLQRFVPAEPTKHRA